MGDRLVTKIAYKGKFIAGSYQHWSASDGDLQADILDEILCNMGFFDGEGENATTENAVKALIETIKKAYEGEDPECGLHKSQWYLSDPSTFEGKDYHSDAQEKFINEHPEFPIGRDRTSGYITVDEKIYDDWERWAEAVNLFDWS